MQPVVADRDRTAPPAAPGPGARHLVAPGASGDWAGHAGKIAIWDGNAWYFETPLPGWQVHCLAEDEDLRFGASGWHAASGRGRGAAHLGLNAEADATDRLSLSAPSTLLNHEGEGHRLKINRAGGGDTASLLFQTGFSGGAEMGLAGEADFSFKTSADGAGWTTALRLSAEDGRASGAAVQSDPLDATPGRLLAVGGFGLGAMAAPVAADADAALTGGSFARPRHARGGHGGGSAHRRGAGRGRGRAAAP
ncbi:DUF2793 domain-containing protein [Limimaricola cinnabarinus]|uniref:DUF2793 domain-containing protein n=1 Tax=Limimaricola cinnabarinus TaxID=1125964 RepID=UPI0013A66601|nr:DUF2793 domain-containing protein [Limimaricola cinnabarinus]